MAFQAHIVKYYIKSADALAADRVNVLEEGSNNVLWYKERVITEDEIVGTVMDAATNTLRWSIHRPRKGWYIRLHSPSLPKGAFIPLLPPPQNVPSTELPTTNTSPVVPRHEEGSLAFSVRTREQAKDEEEPTSDIQITVTEHSYPPSPPQALSSPNLSVPNADQIRAKLSNLPRRKSGIIRRFMLYPSLSDSPVTATATSGFFSRAFAFLTPRLSGRASYSFTLTPALPIGGSTLPLLTFTDQTPTFSVSITGVLEVNMGLERQMGIDPSFWIAVSLAYLEFLEDRESYLAAADG